MWLRRHKKCLLVDEGDGGRAPAADTAAALGGPDELAGACGGVVLEPPAVVFVGGIGLVERTGNGGGEVTRGDADDGVGGDGDLRDDQTVGGGGGDSWSNDVAGRLLVSGGGRAASGGIIGSRSGAGDVVEEEGGTTGGAAGHGEGHGQRGAGDGVSGVEGLHVARDEAIVEHTTNLGVGVAVAVGDTGDIETGAIDGGGDDEITRAGELQGHGAALTGRNGFLLQVDDANARGRSGSGTGREEGDSDGVPAIGNAHGEGGIDSAVRGLDLVLSGLWDIAAREAAGGAQEGPRSRALEPLFGKGGTVFFGGLIDQIAVVGGREGTGGDGSQGVAGGGGSIERTGQVEPFGGIDHGDVLDLSTGERDGEDVGAWGGGDAVGGDGLVAVAVGFEESERVAFVIGDSSGSARVDGVLESGEEHVTGQSASSGEVGGIALCVDEDGVGGAFRPDESGDGGTTGRRGRGRSGGGIGIGTEIIGRIRGANTVGVRGGRRETGVIEGSRRSGSDLGKAGAARALAAFHQIGGNAQSIRGCRPR
jgi:hypothetical protein